MQRGRALHQLALILILVGLAYATLYGLIQYRRAARGPWIVAFQSDAGVPTLVVNQAKLEIRDIRIMFPGQNASRSLPQAIAFSEARAVPFDVPFGRCMFLDPLFLPGTVVLEVFGHQIQLMPRVLTLDGKERPWQSGETISLFPTNTAASSP